MTELIWALAAWGACCALLNVWLNDAEESETETGAALEITGPPEAGHAETLAPASRREPVDQ